MTTIPSLYFQERTRADDDDKDNKNNTPSNRFDLLNFHNDNDDSNINAFLRLQPMKDTPSIDLQHQLDEDFRHRPSNIAKMDSVTVCNPTCLAIFGIVMIILGLCLFLSNIYTGSDDTTSLFQRITSTSYASSLIDSTHQQQTTTTNGNYDGFFAMTLAEQHNLLKRYLGNIDDNNSGGWKSFSNMKLPAGGNPIDLIRLLKSRVIVDGDE